MKMRKRRKQFWWTWHVDSKHIKSHLYGMFDWGVGRVNHQVKDNE